MAGYGNTQHEDGFKTPAVRTLAGAQLPVTAAAPGDTVQQLRAAVALHFGPAAGCRLFLNVILLAPAPVSRDTSTAQYKPMPAGRRLGVHFAMPNPDDLLQRGRSNWFACLQGTKLSDRRTLGSLGLQSGQFLVRLSKSLSRFPADLPWCCIGRNSPCRCA